MPVSMTPYRVFPDYRHIDPAFFTRHGIRLLLCLCLFRFLPPLRKLRSHNGLDIIADFLLPGLILLLKAPDLFHLFACIPFNHSHSSLFRFRLYEEPHFSATGTGIGIMELSCWKTNTETAIRKQNPNAKNRRNDLPLPPVCGH